MSVPQVIVTLDPQGNLIAELPGFMATRRKVSIRASDAGETLLRILDAQRHNRAEIGLDGAPTQAQVKHWERHGTWADASCRFCQAEGRVSAGAKARKAGPVVVVKGGKNAVEVKRLPAGKSFRHKTLESKRSAEDMGL